MSSRKAEYRSSLSASVKNGRKSRQSHAKSAEEEMSLREESREGCVQGLDTTSVERVLSVDLQEIQRG